MHDPEWWRSFFSGLAVETWERATSARATLAEVELLLHVSGKPNDLRVLDVPCGHGRHAIELSSRGCDVTGVDFSREFLERARTLARERGVHVRWLERDMRDLPWLEEFDVACCFGNSFGYMDDASNMKFLSAVARSLRPGGRFLLEAGATVAEVALTHYRENHRIQYGDLLFQYRNRYHLDSATIETDFTFEEGETTERRTGFQRILSYAELGTVLRSSGFQELKALSGVCGTPFVLGSPRMIVVATKSPQAI